MEIMEVLEEEQGGRRPVYLEQQGQEVKGETVEIVQRQRAITPTAEEEPEEGEPQEMEEITHRRHHLKEHRQTREMEEQEPLIQ